MRFFLQFFIILFTLFFSGFSFAGISCAQKAITGAGKHPGFSCNAWQGSGWAEIGRDVSPTDPDVFSATCGRVSSCTCPTGSDLTSHTDESGAAYADCATNSGEGDGQGDTQTSSSVPPCDGDPDTIEICQGSDNSSSDSGQNSSEPSSTGGGSGSSSGSGSDSSSGSGSGSSAGSGDNGSGDIPDNSSSGNPGSGGDSGSGQGGGGGGSGGSGTGGAEYDECLILHDPAFCDSAFSSSSSGQDCLPGYHYYPNTFTCVPDSSSSSSSSFSSGSSSSNSSKASSSAGSSSSLNYASSSSLGAGGGSGGGSNSSGSGECDPTAKNYLDCLTGSIQQDAGNDIADHAVDGANQKMGDGFNNYMGELQNSIDGVVNGGSGVGEGSVAGASDALMGYLPSPASCQPIILTYHNWSASIDCTYIDVWKLWFGWFLNIMVAIHLYELARKPVEV